jgi:hypothetical protein
LSDSIPALAIPGWQIGGMKQHHAPLEWKRPPWRYLVLYLDAVTTPILSIVIALAIVGLRSLFR